jgi:hypothetical protein
MPNCISFRELRRQTRLVRLKRKGAALGVSSESLASFSRHHSCEFGDAIAFVEPSKESPERESFEFFVDTLTSLASREMDNEKLNGEELEGLDIAYALLKLHVDGLRDLAPFGDAARKYFDDLEWALRSAHHIGSACEEIPKQWLGPGKASQLKRLQDEEARLKTEAGRKRLLELRPRQQRLAIMEPLVVEARQADENMKAPSIAKHIRPALEKELNAKGMPLVEPGTIRKDVEHILKELLWL